MLWAQSTTEDYITTISNKDTNLNRIKRSTAPSQNRLAVKSSMVPERHSRLRDRWCWWCCWWWIVRAIFFVSSVCWTNFLRRLVLWIANRPVSPCVFYPGGAPWHDFRGPGCSAEQGFDSLGNDKMEISVDSRASVKLHYGVWFVSKSLEFCACLAE